MIYLYKKNLRTKRPSAKLDFVKVGPYKIIEQIGPINYKLKLLAQSCVYPIFHMSLLERAPPGAKLETT